jgi:ADP-dependent NAD(P)H-hydrate dehydratase
MAAEVETIVRLPVLGARPLDGNKGTFGKVLVVAGSRGMSGAAILCAGGALRGGAGLVQVAVPSEILPIVAAANPCYLTAPLPQDMNGQLSGAAYRELPRLAEASDVVALGPGCGRGEGITAIASTFVATCRKPLVLDADGLNALAAHRDGLRGTRPGDRPLVLTPHPGEFARLVNADVSTVQANRQALAVRFAAEHGVILALKGYQTLVTDGRRLYQNNSGNPGMATGGTGDVLTGLIAALLGQGLEPFGAAQLGVYLHGLAGDLARDALGEISLIASDLLEYLPRAIRAQQA